MSIPNVAKLIDQAYTLEPGKSLRKIRTLMASRLLMFDIRKSWSGLKVGELEAPSDLAYVGERFVENQ